MKYKKIQWLMCLVAVCAVSFSGLPLIAEENAGLKQPEQSADTLDLTNEEDEKLNSRQIAAGEAVYSEEYYREELDGSYTLVKTVGKSGIIGTEVRIISSNNPIWEEVVDEVSQFGKQGFTSDYSSENSSGVVEADGSLVLKIYATRITGDVFFTTYKEEEYIRLNLKFGESFIEPEAPYREGCKFVAWVTTPIFQRQVSRQQTVKNITDCSTDIPDGYTLTEVSTTIESPQDYRGYVPLYEPLPPTPIPTPIPTPNPGRTCQDDGYADGYTWNGTACVLPEIYVVPNTATK